MSLQHWRARFLLAALVLAGALACRTEDILNVAQQPAATPTRTPRPTFTPLASPTTVPTVLPTNPPPQPTAVPVVSAPTKAPTKKPTVKPTPKPAVPPTQPPAPQPTQPPTVPPFQWAYHATSPSCEHSGQAFIKGAVYNDKNDPSSKTPGIPVAMGPADGTSAWVNVKTDDNGEFTFMLNDKGAKPGSYWVWVTDSKGSRISEVGGPIVMNNLGPDAPGTCWHATIDFYK